MKILFDHNVPRRLAGLLTGHLVLTTRAMGWEKLGIGALLKAAGGAAFEAFLSIDKNIEYEQNLRSLPLPVIVIDGRSNALPVLVPFVPSLLDLCRSPLERVLYIVEPNGTVLRLVSPRR